MSLQIKYKKLVEDMQRYLLAAHAPCDVRLVDKTTYAFFQKETKLAHASKPQFKPAPIVPQPTEVKKIVPIAAPPKPKFTPPPKIEAPKEETPLPSFRSEAKVSEKTNEPIFSEVEKLIKKIAPHFTILEEPTLKDFAPPKKNEEAIFLLFDQAEEIFMNRISKAMKEQLGLIPMISPILFENSDAFLSFCQKMPIKLFIGEIENIISHPILKPFFRRSPNNSLNYLAGLPLIALEKEAAYEKEPAKKRSLWNEIKGCLKDG